MAKTNCDLDSLHPHIYCRPSHCTTSVAYIFAIALLTWDVWVITVGKRIIVSSQKKNEILKEF